MYSVGMSDSTTPRPEGVPVAVLADGRASVDAIDPSEELRTYPHEADSGLPAVPTDAAPAPERPDAAMSSFGAEPGRRYLRTAPAIAVPEGGGKASALHADASPLELRTSLTIPPPPPEVGPWRRLLRRGPAPEVTRRYVARAVMQSMLARPVTIVMAQPKGGAGKTPTAIGIASAIGAARGGDVCVMDNSEVRGSLGLRVQRDDHGRSIADLLQHLSWFEHDPGATVLALEWLMHRQDAGFRVLTTDPMHASRDDNLDDQTWLTGANFRRIHSVLTRYFPLVVIDNGQSELANWRASIDVADVIVVPLQLRQDHLNLAAEMISDLKRRFHERADALLDDPERTEAERVAIRAAHDLSRRIMIVVSNGGTRPEPGVADKAAAWFGDFRSVQIPYDKAINREAPMVWKDLRQTTQDAYNRAGATAMRMATDSVHSNPTPPKELT